MAYSPAQGSMASASPLSPEQFAQIEAAQVRSKRVRRAIKVAAVDAWTSSIFAALGLMFSVMNPLSILVGVGFTAVAFQSFRGLYQLKRLELRSTQTLAVNQLLLAGLVTAYGLYSIWDTLHNGATDPMLEDPMVKQAVGDLGPLIMKAMVAAYVLLIIGTIVLQGLTAWYYASRRKYLAAYLNETPGWVLELQKKQAGAS